MAKNWITKAIAGAYEGAVQSLAGERRGSLENPQTPLSYPAEWLMDIFNGGRTDSGIRVSEMTALQVSTVLACVNIITDGISSLPLHVYEKVMHLKRMGKKVAHDHSLYNLLHNEPNPEMTAPVMLKTFAAHCLLWGNGYLELQRDNSAQVIAIWPRNPARTRPIRLLKPFKYEGDMLPVGTMIYETTESIADSQGGGIGENDSIQIGMRRLVLAEDMIHVPGLSLDGRLGQSTVYLARQVIGLSLAAEKYAAKFFGNGARPAGVLEFPSTMQAKAIENVRRSWAEAHGGENAWKTAMLEGGVKYTKIAATPNEGQLLETRAFQRAEICATFGVPLHMVGASGDKIAKGSVEQTSIEFVLYCLDPWLVRIEKEFGRKLFPKLGRSANKFFPKFDPRKLMYPDAASRAAFYNGGKQWGYLCTNDIHELEDLNPVEDGSGDKYWMPINMQDAGDPQYMQLGAQAQHKFDQDNPDHQLKGQGPTPPDNDGVGGNVKGKATKGKQAASKREDVSEAEVSDVLKALRIMREQRLADTPASPEEQA
jgi:HK97 family phage portal protein